jgi:hypothetical protein
MIARYYAWQRRRRARALYRAAIAPWPTVNKLILAANVAKVMRAGVNRRAWRNTR